MSQAVQHISIDLSTDGIRAVSVGAHNEIELLAKLELDLPPTTFESSALLNQYRSVFIEKLKEIEFFTPNISLLIPEDTIIVQLIDIPKVKDEELPEAIYWKLKGLLPKDIESYSKDFLIVGQKDNNYTILTFSVPLYIFEFFSKVFKELQLNPILLEPHAISLHRLIRPVLSDKKLYGIIHMTANGTTLTLANNKTIIFTQTVPTGINTILERLQISLNVPRDQLLDLLKKGTIKKENIINELTKLTDNIYTEFLRMQSFVAQTTGIKQQVAEIFIVATEPSIHNNLKFALLSKVHKNTKLNSISLTQFVKLPKELPPKALTPDFASAIGLNLRQTI